MNLVGVTFSATPAPSLAVDELNGWTYSVSNFQHPGDRGAAHKGVKATLDPLVRANYKDKFAAAVGRLTADVSQVKLAKG